MLSQATDLSASSKVGCGTKPYAEATVRSYHTTLTLKRNFLQLFLSRSERDAPIMPPSTQDPSYWEDYRAYCQTREEAQLPFVSYRN